jgi:hypothetical protein
MQQLCTPVITVPRRLPWLELKLIGLRRLKRLVPVAVRRRYSLEVHGDDMRRCDQLLRVLFIGSPQVRARLIGGLRDLDPMRQSFTASSKPACGVSVSTRAIAINGWGQMPIAHICMTAASGHPKQSWRCPPERALA